MFKKKEEKGKIFKKLKKKGQEKKGQKKKSRCVCRIPKKKFALNVIYLVFVRMCVCMFVNTVKKKVLTYKKKGIRLFFLQFHLILYSLTTTIKTYTRFMRTKSIEFIQLEYKCFISV